MVQKNAFLMDSKKCKFSATRLFQATNSYFTRKRWKKWKDWVFDRRQYGARACVRWQFNFVSDCFSLLEDGRSVRTTKPMMTFKYYRGHRSHRETERKLSLLLLHWVAWEFARVSEKSRSHRRPIATANGWERRTPLFWGASWTG